MNDKPKKVVQLKEFIKERQVSTQVDLDLNNLKQQLGSIQRQIEQCVDDNEEVAWTKGSAGFFVVFQLLEQLSEICDIALDHNDDNLDNGQTGNRLAIVSRELVSLVMEFKEAHLIKQQINAQNQSEIEKQSFTDPAETAQSQPACLADLVNAEVASETNPAVCKTFEIAMVNIRIELIEEKKRQMMLYREELREQLFELNRQRTNLQGHHLQLSEQRQMLARQREYISQLKLSIPKVFVS